jgi:hypothetical protein
MAYTNLLTNGNFDTDTSGWSVVGGSTLTRTTVLSHSKKNELY